MISVLEKGNHAVLSELSGREGDDILIRGHETYTGITILVVNSLKYFQILHLLRLQVTYDAQT